MMKQKEQ